jgi:hypothetical protein
MNDKEFEAESGYLENMGGTRKMIDEALRARASEAALLADRDRLLADVYDKVQALAAVSTILGSSQHVPAEWDRYGAVQDARAVMARLAGA